MRPLTPLCELAAKHQSDKGGRHLMYSGRTANQTHEYTPVYWDLLNVQRSRVKSVLEIGIHHGAGLRMWEEFFPNALITGLDVNKECLIPKTGRIQTFYADQADPHSLMNALQLAQANPFDLIVDDGSHLMHDQAASMAALLPYLSDIGVYVIEDIPKDFTWAEFLRKNVPDGYHFGVIYPERGVGQEAVPEQLFVITRE